MWFYRATESEPAIGPVSDGELSRLASTGVIGPKSLLRDGRSTNWIVADDVAQLEATLLLAGLTDPSEVTPPEEAEPAGESPANKEPEYEEHADEIKQRTAVSANKQWRELFREALEQRQSNPSNENATSPRPTSSRSFNLSAVVARCVDFVVTICSLPFRLASSFVTKEAPASEWSPRTKRRAKKKDDDPSKHFFVRQVIRAIFAWAAFNLAAIGVEAYAGHEAARFPGFTDAPGVRYFPLLGRVSVTEFQFYLLNASVGAAILTYLLIAFIDSNIEL